MYNRNYFIAAIDHALDVYIRDHGNLKPDAIHIHSQKWDDVVCETELSGHEWDDFLWGIPVVQDDTIDTAWKFVGTPVLEHKKCMLCGIVVSRKVHWHNLDGYGICKHCYKKIMHNKDVMDGKWQRTVFENNRRVAKSMNEEYFKNYKDLLFGDSASWFEKE